MDTVDRALVLERVTKLLEALDHNLDPFDIALDPASCSIKVANPGLDYIDINSSAIVRKYCSRYALEPRIKISKTVENRDHDYFDVHVKKVPFGANAIYFMTGSNPGRLVNIIDRLHHPKSITLRITFHGIRNDDVHGLVLSYVAQHLPEHVHVLRMANRLRVSWRDSRGDDINGWIWFVGSIMQFQLRRLVSYKWDADIVKFNLGSMAQVLPEKFSERVNHICAISINLDQWASNCLLVELDPIKVAARSRRAS